MVIKLTDLMFNTINELNNYEKRLTVGLYHLTAFTVINDPRTLRRTAYLNCKEGKFWTVSSGIIHELDNDVGRKLREALTNNEVEIEVIPYRSRLKNRLNGVMFRLESRNELPTPSNTIEPQEKELERPLELPMLAQQQ